MAATYGIDSKLKATEATKVALLKSFQDALGEYTALDDVRLERCRLIEIIYDIFMNERRWTSRRKTFWSFVEKFIHPNICGQIKKSARSKLEMDMCKEWICQSLEDGLLSSYMKSMAMNEKIMRGFYKKISFLRDWQFQAAFIESLSDIEARRFGLHENQGSVFDKNRTSTEHGKINCENEDQRKLEILKSTNSSMKDNESAVRIGKTNISSSHSESVLESGVGQILSRGTRTIEFVQINSARSFTKSASSQSTSCKYLAFEHSKLRRSSISTDDGCRCPGGKPILKRSRSCSSPLKPIMVNACVQTMPSTDEDVEESEEESYENILMTYRQNSAASLNSIVSLETILQSLSIDSESGICIDVFSQDVLDEVVEMSLLLEIVPESGLSADTHCANCNSHCVLQKHPNCCSYDRKYYCDDCFKMDRYYIPAQIVHNWNFTKFAVARCNYEKLQELSNEPLIDLSVAQPHLHYHIPELRAVRSLREQMDKIYCCLLSCCSQDAANLMDQWPPLYFHEQLDLYSLSAMVDVYSGKLLQDFRKLVNLTTIHIRSCELCRWFGTICNICNGLPALLPGDWDAFKCPRCEELFHRECLPQSTVCITCSQKKANSYKSRS